jgi:hypothetical protein
MTHIRFAAVGRKSVCTVTFRVYIGIAENKHFSFEDTGKKAIRHAGRLSGVSQKCPLVTAVIGNVPVPVWSITMKR